MTASTTAWLLSPTTPVPPRYPNQGRWLSQLLIARTQLLQKAAKRHSPKAFQEMRWIGNTDALLAPTCGTSPARGRLTLLGAGLIGVPAKVRAGTHCRSALELLHSTKALPVQLDQPRPLEETQLLSTKGALVPEKVKPPHPQQNPIYCGAVGGDSRGRTQPSALGFIARQLFWKEGFNYCYWPGTAVCISSEGGGF